jgi:hypothetical protein
LLLFPFPRDTLSRYVPGAIPAGILITISVVVWLMTAIGISSRVTLGSPSPNPTPRIFISSTASWTSTRWIASRSAALDGPAARVKTAADATSSFIGHRSGGRRLARLRRACQG